MDLIKCRKGSVQVVEFSFVLPCAMAVVLALMYFTFAAFTKVYAVSVVQSAVNDMESYIGDESLYWQLKEEYISEQDLSEITASLNNTLEKISILPGTSLKGTVSLSSRLHMPYITVNAEAFYFGKSVFCITEDRRVYVPYEYVLTCDFGKTIENDFDELKDIYDEVF